VACPGLIDEHGTILRGGQTCRQLQGEDFNLPAALAERLGHLGGHEPALVVHNDAWSRPERSAEHAGRGDLGRAHDRYRSWQRTFTNRPVPKSAKVRLEKRDDRSYR